MLDVVFIAELPDFMGYGITAVGKTHYEAERLAQRLFLLKRKTLEERGYDRHYFDWWTWTSAKEYFGFSCVRVPIGTVSFGPLTEGPYPLEVS